MTAETFFANFGHLADAPNGVRKLRELILQLAVQGKLVPQDPNDEPASVLLENIETAKERLVSEGRIKLPKTLPPISEDGVPFELPRAWEWCRFGALGLIGSSSRVHKKDWKSKGVPFLRAREIVKLSQFGTADNELFISEELFQELSNGGLVPEENDLMITGVGTIGIPYIVKKSDRFYFKDASVLIFKNHYGLYSRFLSCLLRTPYWIDTIHKESMGTTVHTLTISRANEVPIPLPPLEEQTRIVAKVDQLMALCDELEARQQKQQQGRVRLNNAALDALLTARDHDEFADHWQRISTNFDLLYDHPESIAKLRATILQLAVQGKLVPQDSNDEPASVLLESVRKEKSKQGPRRGSSRTAPSEPLGNDEIPFELPASWRFEWFGNLTDVVGGVTLGRKLTGKKTVAYPYLRVANVQRWTLDLTVLKEVEILEDELEKYRLQQGDLLITEGGDWDKVGRTAIWEGQVENCLHQNHVFRARLVTEQISREWLMLVINSPVGREYFANSSKQTTNLASINMTQLKHFPMPVPPAFEQHRIVAKVDQLMTMCDELEAELNLAQQHSEKLMEATVRQLLGPSAPQKPHTARVALAPAASKPVRQERHVYQPVSATAEPLAAEAVADYSGSIPDAILAAMQPGQEYSRADILATTGIREADWMWAIKQLKEQGRVVQIGEKRGARYRLRSAGYHKPQ